MTDQFLAYFMLYRAGEYLEMARKFEPMAVEVDDRPVLGVFYKNIAHCLWLYGHWGRHSPHGPSGGGTVRGGRNPAGVGMACNMIEWTHMVLGDFDQALAWEAKALAAFEQDMEPTYCVFARTGGAWTLPCWGNGSRPSANAGRRWNWPTSTATTVSPPSPTQSARRPFCTRGT